MTIKEKLEALIRKAIEGGWDAYGWPDWAIWGEDTVMFYDKTQERDHTKMVQYGNEIEVSTIIFNHDFARAALRIKPSYAVDIVCDLNGVPEPNIYHTHQILDNWQYHLQQAVVSPEPIDYLYQAVFGDEKI